MRATVLRIVRNAATATPIFTRCDEFRREPSHALGFLFLMRVLRWWSRTPRIAVRQARKQMVYVSRAYLA